MDKDTERVIIIGAVATGIWYLFGKLGSMVPSFGKEDEVEDRKVQQEALKIDSPFNPNFYKTGPVGTLLITSQAANTFVLAILNSVGWFQDDFSKVLGIFKQLKTQSQVSYLADKFAAYEGQDLLTWLRGSTYPNDRFSAEEVNQIVQYAKSLPKYKL